MVEANDEYPNAVPDCEPLPAASVTPSASQPPIVMPADVMLVAICEKLPSPGTFRPPKVLIDQPPCVAPVNVGAPVVGVTVPAGRAYETASAGAVNERPGATLIAFGTSA